MDENGHGTHCAGIIGAEGENDLGIAGVNWNVKIMPLKFMNCRWFWNDQRRDRGDQLRYRSQEGRSECSRHQCELGFDAEVSRARRRDSQS